VAEGRHFSRFLFHKQGEQGPTAEQLGIFIDEVRSLVNEQTEEQRAYRVPGMLSRAGLKLM
jgi:ribosomal protein L13E